MKLMRVGPPAPSGRAVRRRPALRPVRAHRRHRRARSSPPVGSTGSGAAARPARAGRHRPAGRRADRPARAWCSASGRTTPPTPPSPAPRRRPTPIMFYKAPNTVVGPYDDVLIPRGSTTHRLGGRARRWSSAGRPATSTRPAQALAHVAGYVVSNDVSERDFQLASSGGQWSKGKSCETFKPLGPWLVTAGRGRRPAGARPALLGQRRAPPGLPHRRHDLRRGVPDLAPVAVHRARPRRRDQHRYAAGRRALRPVPLPAPPATWWRSRSTAWAGSGSPWPRPDRTRRPPAARPSGCPARPAPPAGGCPAAGSRWPVARFSGPAAGRTCRRRRPARCRWSPPERGEARNATAWATSSAVTSRPVGWRAASRRFSAAGSSAPASSRATHGVSTVPGATVHTRMPSPDEVGGHGQAERVHRALGGGIDRPVDQPRRRRDRGDADDGAAGRAAQVGQGGPAGPGDADDVDVEAAVPLVVAGVPPPSRPR